MTASVVVIEFSLCVNEQDGTVMCCTKFRRLPLVVT